MTIAPDTFAICPLRLIEETIAASGATRLISVVNPHLMPPTPTRIDPALHLRLPITDAMPERGEGPHPARHHIERLMEFTLAWPRDAPILIHCFSGLNRSPAAAYIMLAALNPNVPETLIAYRLRAASETASPNRIMVGIADLVLQRHGFLSSAIELIGPGQPAAEGPSFLLSTAFDIG